MRLGLSMGVFDGRCFSGALTSSTRPSSACRRRAGSVVDARRVDRRPERSPASTYVYRTVGTGPIRKTPPPRSEMLLPQRPIARPSVHRRAARIAPWPSPRRS